ncbi:MmgE/PrpD family protein [Phenylobacterium sp.]|jgi:2-methylcitrate dehydratase PrpD|uniref:MmgE/PrpD family protein n=1 Tax=Phenylobacterium sp. TaxID=1871053 RepID=UPI0025D1F995|nr:MmgE/PrpD family protein [Phenylobacterium sp.]MCA3585786.1 MmgE/PrpD family protein [Methylocystis sp.]MCA6285416.1 MmgE/PrpD family protein [Phenylobacterium sp.]MCA6289977.1 MmgE/PrpD family protein [Phenylobacterium sp.]MCA6343093.1 MmgE/PrpD family protein [Phenylobacterium sp.]MCA6346230.1 MmgE/PrpD family protein [Phenylobacterium sp.]
MTLSRTLTDRALALSWSDIDATARAAAKTFLHDTLCVGAAGARAPLADNVLAAARRWGEGTACGVLGRPGVRLPQSTAAFVNAFQIHAQEFDCVHEPAVVHPMATVGTVILSEADRASAENDPVSGEALLTALVAGVEVAASLGLAATTPLKFFRPATAGIFGCVAALISLRLLPVDQGVSAFGYALAFASGAMQAHAEGKPALPVQIANAARAAVMAVDLAEAGMPGPEASLDGPFGYLALFETAHDLTPLTDPAPGFRIAEVSWKPFPTGRAAHGGIVALQTLMADHGLKSTDVAEIVYRAPPLIHRLVGRRPSADMAPAWARLCLPWLGAVVLTRGTVGLADFTTERLADPVLLQLADRIRVEADDNPDPAAFTPATLTVSTTDGHLFRHTVTAQLGSPAQPLTLEQHLAKQAACLDFAGLGANAAVLADMIDRFETLPDAAAILSLLGAHR